MRATLTCLLVVLSVAAFAPGAETTPAEPSPAENLAAAKAVAPSLVKVEYTLKFDKGEDPEIHGCAYRCPNCGQYHGYSGGEAVREERPVEVGGFLVAPDQVISTDPMVHPRFVKEVGVRFGKTVVPARPVAYARGQSAVVLQLDKPLEGAKPLAFDPSRKGPYLAVTYGRENAVWTVSVQSVGTTLATDETGRQFVSAPTSCLITDKSGGPVALSMNEELPPDDSWKRSPLDWAVVSRDDLSKRLTELEAKADKALLRVTVNFRSPKKDARSASYFSDDESATEVNTVGVLLSDTQVLVLANLKPSVTARLERITVNPPAGDPVKAQFAGTLKDYGAFVAKLDAPMTAGLALSSATVLEYRHALLPSAEVKVQGKQRQAYFAHRRISGYNIGWRQHVYPGVVGSEEGLFLFDDQYRLVALPVARREKVTGERSYSPGGATLTAAVYVKEVADDLAANTDPSNVPLTEEEENRLAWLGVELQPLNRELARVNGVSDETRDGSTGALVSYVYPGSPADKAGIKMGYILLRLLAEDVPKPIEVTVEEYAFAEQPFPWDRLDQLPERYYDRIPNPWPPAENNVTRTLTDLGFGKNFTAVFFHDGKTIRRDFQVAQSPAHYETAKRFKTEAIGLTVRDLTYEVRRYFQKKDDDLGVIVSKIEPGSKASVAGVKPYEVVTHVNDKPVRNVKDFETLIHGQEELRLMVMRMDKGRTVKISVTGPTSAPAPSSRPAGELDEMD